MINFEDLEFYVSGTPSTSCVIVLPEVWGIASGRLKSVTDQIAKRGYYCILPKIQPGSPYGGWEGDGYGHDFEPALFQWVIAELPWNKTKLRLEKVIKYAKSTGAIRIGTIGFCWGAWALFKANVEFGADITCGVSCHPSVRLEELAFGLSQNELAQKITCPMAVFAAGNDPDNVKPGGDFQKIFNEKEFGKDCVFQEFPAMQHGWVIRGDISDPTIKNDVETALSLSFHFLDKHLK
eukprot:TRINITY_DN4378_c0_g1_i4.p1 TRINITY_DN4378_c0_g1~~TRINITY_DN4378_c0_g1_i4.p1  ORF type:complete len:256 (-),score=56.76 TRINITY_DN4378_c0_g1_i4:184-894(-)